MSMAVKYAMQKRSKKMADGGEAQPPPPPPPSDKAIKMAESMRKAFNYDHGGEVCYACGGEVKHMAEGGKAEHDDDFVSGIMSNRVMGGYSEGGKVANDVGEGQDADKLPNQFDDLVLRDDLESEYDAKNSGDELGNEQEDEDQRDVVSQVMKSRKKKDHLPNPR